jgi:hypothetical protein
LQIPHNNRTGRHTCRIPQSYLYPGAKFPTVKQKLVFLPINFSNVAYNLQ